MQPFPEPGEATQVSTDGGEDPLWNRDGRELIYASPAQNMMACACELSPTFRPGVPVALFRVPAAVVALDFIGGRVLGLAQVNPGSPTSVAVTLNWTAALAPPPR